MAKEVSNKFAKKAGINMKIRLGLKLFKGAPEVKEGLEKLGFRSPDL